MGWVKDPSAESRLKRLGAKFTFIKGVKVKQIDIEMSLRNNARVSKPLIPDLVMEYGLAMLDGHDFPAIIVTGARRKQFTYDILAGNHRAAAAIDADINTFDVYFVKTDDERLRDLIARTDNRAGGGRQDRREAVLHALALRDMYNMPLQEIAPFMNLKTDWLRKAVRVDGLKEKFLHLNVETRDMADTTINVLGQLEKSDVLMRQAAKLVVEHKVPNARVKAMVGETSKAGGEEQGLAVLDDWEGILVSERAATTRVRPGAKAKLSAGDIILRQLNGLRRLLGTRGPRGGEIATFGQLQITSAKRQAEVKQTIGEVSRILRTISRSAQ